MSEEEEDRIHDERPAKRFKHQSYKDSLKEVHLTPAYTHAQFNDEIGDNDSHFHEALQHWQELNLAPEFLSFVKKADGLSSSMPLLVHHWKEVVGQWLEAVDGADDEGLKPLLDLSQKLAHDLRVTISPLRNEILSRLLKLLPRSLLADTLTALLETFSALFRYVTIPSDDMCDVWFSFVPILPKCDPEVQRAVAELWGSTLRRMKPYARERCVVSIVNSASPDVSAWCFVSACKSVSQTLHTIAPTILSPILLTHIESEDRDSSFTVIRRVLTALIHHCKGAEQFAPLGDILVNELVKAPKEDTDALQRLVEVVVVACSVRSGTRLTAKHLHMLLSQFPLLPLSEKLHAALLKFAVACLTAGDMALWMGPGRKMFERLWEERPSLALDLSGALSDLNWGGWKLFALPHVLKRIPGVLETHPQKALEMLCSLQESGRLESTDMAWKERIQRWVEGRLQEWSGSDDQILELYHIIELSNILPDISAIIVNIVNLTMASADPKDYREHATNSSWIIGSCLRCLARRKTTEWISMVDLSQWTETVIQRWAWSGYALEGLVLFMEDSASQNHKVAFDSIYEQLKDSLLSYSRRLRLSALRILCSQIDGIDGGTSEVLRRCLLGEEVSIDVQGVRERVLRMSRMNQILGDDDELGADIAARWLIAQLKVNLRPLWKPSGEVLASLSARFGDQVWRLLFADLQDASAAETLKFIPEWMKEVEGDLDSISEEERTWRDPSAHKFRVAVNRWLRGDMARLGLIKAQFVEERFDPAAYEVQLLAALAQCPALAEKHSRDLVPHFLTLAPPDSPTKLPRRRLSAWLTLYSKFVNPKALRSTDDLLQIYMTLLCHPERPLQRLSLSCILTYKTPSVVSRQDLLNALLDDTQWRDQLTQLDIAEISVDERSDVVPIIVRVLFGLMLERHGRSRGADRRAAVLTALAGCTDDELCLLADLMLNPINKDRDQLGNSVYAPQSLPDSVTDKQLVGFLNLLGDVLKNLGSRLLQCWPVLLATLLDIVDHAQSRIQTGKGDDETEIDVLEEGDLDHEDSEDEHSASRSIRTVRRLGLKRFTDFFRVPVGFNFDPYMRQAFQSFISPRLPLLAIENTQAPSSLLELFHVWSTDAHFARYLAIYDHNTLPKTYACLIASNVKPAVVSKVFDIIENLLGICSTDQELLEAVFRPHVSLLLGNLALMIECNKMTASVTEPMGRRQIAILSQLAPFMTDSTQASTLLNLFLPILRRPSNLVPEKVKWDILNIVKGLLPLVSDLRDADSTAYTRLYSVLAFLYQNLRSRNARLALGSTFRSLSDLNGSSSRVVNILDALNACSTKRLEEPDFDRRLTAFATLNETLHSSLSAQEWLPILYNMLNFIQDPDELTVRNNASLAMKRFVDLVAASGGEYEGVFLKVLYPGLKNGLRSKNEPVRAEILGVVSYAVSHCERITTLQEMRGLLAAGDEEANFFNNILHVQVHRRTRAMRRLTEYCEEGKMRSTLLAEIFVPLIGNFIAGVASVDHHLVNEAIITTGRISRHLQWGAYYALIQQYLRLIRNKDATERVYVRTVVALLENFHFPMTEVVEVVEEQPADESGDVPEVHLDALEDRKRTHIADAVNRRLLPTLLNHLEKREENDDNLRIPIAIGIVQVAMHLPQASRATQLTKLLTVLSQVFRSKSQDTRDLARETLYKIAITIGPSYLPLIIRELRASLLRGPHLHILAYVVHALLVHVTSDSHASTFTQLDDCVNDVAHVATEVIFGESGKDVLSEDFKTKMREVRSSSSKGLDSFAIIAKYITPPKTSSLLLPIRNILQKTETLKVMQQVEDLLRRIAGGLNANQHLTPKDLLVLCHTLISQNARFLKEVPKSAHDNGKGKGRSKRDTIVELKRNWVDVADHYANNSFRFVVFGLDLFNTAYRRGRFDFQDPAVIARLEPMVAVIGNTLYSSHMQVIVPGMKAATAVVKCPLKSISKSLPVFIRQMIDIVKQTGSTESEVVQTAFKSLATILRDQVSAQVKEKDLVFLLEMLSPDLEEPSRQAAVFSMLRAIVARKFVVPEIYDLIDKVSEIMVTNQSAQVQELCRGVLLQFLLEYPQGKGRLRNHMAFLAKNLSYVHESGRKSVMELLSAILAKFNPALIKEYSDMLFVALVMVVANDDSSKCREMASELIKSLFAKLETQERRVVMSHVHSWAAQHAQAQLARASSQIYSIIIDHLQQDAAPYATSILEDTNAILTNASEQLEAATEDDMELDLEWQVPYHALIALSKLLRVCPEVTTEADKVSWSSVISLLLFPHAWVRTASCRLLGLLFAAVPAAAPNSSLPNDSPFSIVGMEDVTKKLCLQLYSENLDAALSLQIVKNLFYVGKCFSLLEASQQQDEEAKEDGEESDDDEERQEDGQQRHPLSWLFSKLSFQARAAHIARRNKSVSPDNWHHQSASVFQWFAAMGSFLDASILEKYLMHILSPVYRIAEDDTIRDPHMDELKTLAVELQELLQSKVGTTKFAAVYSQIRQNVLGVRRERKTARAVQVTTNPGAAAKRKFQRNVTKKEGRKRKNSTFAEGRGRIKRRKDE